MKPQLLNGSEAIALTINRLKVGVVSAYPITPQTKIVEKLAALRAGGQADFEFVRAESELAAASVVLGAAASGVRAYTASSSQGLLMMAEVLYNLSGLRLPAVMTCANRSLSAPINIWNDHSDVMALRDAGWINFFAEDNQAAIDQHVLAYYLAEKLSLPVMINVDGFILTHLSEPLILPTTAAIKKFLPNLPASANRLDPASPTTTGHLVGPTDFYRFRQKLDQDLLAAGPEINLAYDRWQRLLGRPGARPLGNGLIEWHGPRQAKTVLVAMGSVIGTLKTAADELNRSNQKIAVLQIKTWRPFPYDLVKKFLAKKQAIIINKAVSPGALPPLSCEVAAAVTNAGTKIIHAAAGLGGGDITVEQISRLVKRSTHPAGILYLN